jgi:lipopolysaccharide/colanic/teichoic acid biosynthesis glycosyltransferase
MPCPEGEPLGIIRSSSDEEKPRRRKFPRARRLKFVGWAGDYAIDKPAQWLHEHAPKGEAYLNSRWKRVFDLATVVPMATAGIPIILAEAAYVALRDKTNPFFNLPCVGRDGEIFDRHKIRTMRQGARHEPGCEIPMLVKSKDDPRVLHSRLRKDSLDELPQILNVFKGEMSVIGVIARPPEEIEYFKGTVDWEKDRRPELAKRIQRYLRLYPRGKQGMTGPFQIMGRSNLNLSETVLLEAFYLENASWVLDLSILFGTPFAVISGVGAY